MVTTHNLGFPRIGAKRELKFALESYWKGQSSRDALKSIGAAFTGWSMMPLANMLSTGMRPDDAEAADKFTRLNAKTLEYAITMTDPTVWTAPWTTKQELTMQSDTENRIYYEPRCFEGNYGLPSLLLGSRHEEVAFAEGRGKDPATKDRATCFSGDSGEDPLAGG